MTLRSCDRLSISLVSPAEGENFTEKLRCRFFETSAKLGINVTEAFHGLVCEIRDRNRVSFFYPVGMGSSDLTHILFCIWSGAGTDATLLAVCHARQCHPATRCRLLEGWLHRFLTSSRPASSSTHSYPGSPILYRPTSTIQFSGRSLPFLCMRRLGVYTGRLA